jgi:hypothetical protein
MPAMPARYVGGVGGEWQRIQKRVGYGLGHAVLYVPDILTASSPARSGA